MKPKTYEMFWDNEKDMLHVSCGAYEMSFTKEYLEDMKGWDFVKHLDAMSAQTQSKFTSQYMNEPKPVILDLCLPHIRQLWHLSTGGSVNKAWHDDLNKVACFYMSQSFILKLPIKIFEDQKYSHIDIIFGWLANNWKNLKHISGYDFTIDKDYWYDLGFEWPSPQTTKPSQKSAAQNLAEAFTAEDKAEAKKQLYMAMDSHPPKPPVKELHVYDLGDGMLVPVELAKEIAAWSQLPTKGWSLSKEMIEDDLYGAATITAAKSMNLEKMKELYKAFLIDSSTLTVPDLYPGKVILVDDPKDSPYLTDKDAWLDLTKNQLIDFDFIPDKAMHAVLYGKMISPEPESIKIPKKPKQITKESLEYFHKLLGGKKDPYTK